MKESLLLFVLTLLVQLTFGQSKKNVYADAQLFFYTERIEQALPIYQQLENNGGYEDSGYKLEICKLLVTNEGSFEKLEQLHNALEPKDIYYKYWLGRAYDKNGESAKAVDAFQEFQSETPKIDKNLRADVTKRIGEAETNATKQETARQLAEAEAENQRKAEREILVQGVVVDLSVNQPLSTGTIRFTKTGTTDYVESTIQSDGKYQAKLRALDVFRVTIQTEGQIVHEINFDMHERSEDDTLYRKDFQFHPIETTPSLASNSRGGVQPSSGGAGNSYGGAATDYVGGERKFTYNSDIPGVETRPYQVAGKAVIDNVYFDFGNASLGSDDNPVLNQVFEFLDQNSMIRVEIGGHTDNIGSAQSNLVVSERRAQAVVKWLVDKGIAADRLEYRGYGETMPLASNDNEKDGRELNRRIEVLIIR